MPLGRSHQKGKRERRRKVQKAQMEKKASGKSRSSREGSRYQRERECIDEKGRGEIRELVSIEDEKAREEKKKKVLEGKKIAEKKGGDIHGISGKRKLSSEWGKKKLSSRGPTDYRKQEKTKRGEKKALF